MRLVLALLLCAAVPILGQDWPQFLGPRRDGSYPHPLPTPWPDAGPRPVWKRNVGEGFASPVISRERLILFHRVENKEVIACHHAASGQELWKFAYPATYQDDFGFEAGPRATPAISEGSVFALGADGIVTCLRLEDGKMLWQVNTRKEFDAEKGFFGMACSPLIEKDFVLLNVGGADGAGIVALDRATGKLAWKATEHEASYSSPVAASINEKPGVFFFTREGLVMLEPNTGKVIAEKRWRARMHASVNAATPLFIEPNLVFLTASYGVGAVLLEVNPPLFRPLWQGDESLSSHYASVVHHDGYLFGYDGRQEHGPDLVCVELKTGRLAWREQRFGAGTVLLSGNQLVILRESGELILANAWPKKFTSLAQAQILGETRAYPAISGARLFARDKKQLVCFDFKPDGPK